MIMVNRNNIGETIMVNKDNIGETIMRSKHRLMELLHYNNSNEWYSHCWYPVVNNTFQISFKVEI